MTENCIVAVSRFQTAMLVLWVAAEVGFFLYYVITWNKLKRYEKIRSHGELAPGRVEEMLRKYNVGEDGKGYYTYQITYGFCAEDGEWYYQKLTMEQKECQREDTILVYYNPDNPNDNFTDYHLEKLQTERKYVGMFLGVVTTIFVVIIVSSMVFFKK